MGLTEFGSKTDQVFLRSSFSRRIPARSKMGLRGSAFPKLHEVFATFSRFARRGRIDDDFSTVNTPTGMTFSRSVARCKVDARYVTTFDLIQVQGDSTLSVRGDNLFRERL